MNYQQILEPNKFYHIYNRAVGNSILFPNEKYYHTFLYRLNKFLSPHVVFLAYALIPNHFHLLIKTKSLDTFDVSSEVEQEFLTPNRLVNYNLLLSKKFSNLFNSIARSHNYHEKRKGALFITPYKRICVENDNYLSQLFYYIHRNPVHHGLTERMGDWEYSSYRSILSQEKTWLDRAFSKRWFGSKNMFKKYHEEAQLDWKLEQLFIE